MKNSKNIVLYSPFLNVKCKGHNFFQIYTFLDSDFSTLIENHNNFRFSPAVCAKSSGKLTLGNINPAYSPLKISCRDVIRDISPFLWDKDNHTISLLCSQNGWAGGHC
jgi:hypothetical protein